MSILVHRSFAAITAAPCLTALILCTTALPVHANPNGAWSEMAPPTLDSHGAIYDPVRDRMLVVCGNRPALTNSVWELTLSPGASWHLLSVTGPAPVPREAASAIYDPVRDRVLLFGGGNGAGVVNDVWALSLDASPAWTQLSPAGTAPDARYRHAAIYDPVRDRMIVFAGDVATVFNEYRNDVWALSLSGTPTWSHLTPGGTLPHVRSGPSAVYDPAGDRMVICQGEDDMNGYNDTWSLSLGASPAWTKLLPSGTPPDSRSLAGTAYDPVRQRLMLFGGTGTFNDTWALSLSGSPAWSHLTPSGGPPHGRAAPSLVYDATRDRMLLYGGTGYSPGDDVWALSLDGSPAWTPVLEAVHPGPRSYHTAILDPVRNRMIVYGGTIGGSGYPDVWALNLGTVPSWSQLATTGGTPNGRYYHVAVYDPPGDRMIVYGGSSFNDMWQLALADPPTWTQIVIGGGPGPRYRPAAAYDPIGHRMIVFGGYFNGTYYGDTWALNLDGPFAWSPIFSVAHPSPRDNSQMVFDAVNNRMLLMGGVTGPPSQTIDCWALSLGATPAWTQVSTGGATPVARSQHSLSFDPLRSRVLLESGFGFSHMEGSTSVYGSLDDTQGLDVSGTPTWGALAPAGATPGGRQGATTIYDPDLDRLILFGGNGSSDLQILTFADAAAPLPASLASATRQSGHIQLEWQGREVYRPSALLYRRPVGGSWTPLTTIVPDGSNHLNYDDPQVIDTESYEYTVAFEASGGEQYGETAHLDAATAVETGGASFAIQTARFGDGGLDVTFSLPSSAPARLDLFDVSGRQVGEADLAGMGLGAHSVRLGDRAIASGLYWVRLSQSGRTKVARAIRLR